MAATEPLRFWSRPIVAKGRCYAASGKDQDKKKKRERGKKGGYEAELLSGGSKGGKQFKAPRLAKKAAAEAAAAAAAAVPRAGRSSLGRQLAPSMKAAAAAEVDELPSDEPEAESDSTIDGDSSDDA
ncbi:hypothetical protein OEZ85_003266 [Tetradesmus obliquus]|uniref:Uncharacterized protein n=1 Tax=Tetradesmus obliquus TaxID=3088 RepID=A0ABY8U021_TETOB|nr:hypothetical protein OEZ85_003266 [Tetradesmus obliquus]